MGIKHLFILTGLALFCACAAIRRTPPVSSQFTGGAVRPGMTKEEFIARFGKPFKEGFSRDSGGVLHETLYYKELMGNWYAVNTIFRFEDSVLVSQEQGDEERFYQDCNCTEKKN